MIVTLAGHVDHGKTSLVRALTGVDTDRLEEEKRRGLTIDLGFAYLRDGDQTLGFVDVPGHHKFIHNMVAGVAAMQHALLVIAADDGPMPQSREHLQILQLLGVGSGTIALTKCDRVSETRRAQAAGEVRALVSNTFLQDATVVETSTETGLGIDVLRDTLLQQAREFPQPDASQPFRLAVDRAFTVTGSGVVVTGTVHSGSVAVDDVLTLFPSGEPVRVRGVRAQDTRVEEASCGDRCALNLVGVNIESVMRGHWLTRMAGSGSREFSLQLRLLEDFPRPVKHWQPVHVYHASTHTTGRLALLDDQRLQPGDSQLVELVTSEPLLVERKDRLILRDQSLDRTLGGGEVVAPHTAAGRRRAPQRLERLSADRAASAEAAFTDHLQLGDVDLVRFAGNWRLDGSALEVILRAHNCIRVGNWAVSASQWQAWRQAIVEEITSLHARDTALQGIKQSDLHLDVPRRYLEAALNELVADKQLIARTGRFLPASHSVSLSPQEQQLLDNMTRQLDAAQPPSLGDLSKQLRIPLPQLAKQLLPLVAKKQLVRVSDHRYYLPAQIERLANLAADLHSSGPFTVRQYRDAAAIGRNVAIEVLEFFDSRGYTRRAGDTRTVVAGHERLAI